jgi:hypothetical protein
MNRIKYSPKKTQELEKLYADFQKLHLQRKKIKSDKKLIMGKNRDWKITAPSNMSTGRRSRSASKKKSKVKGKNRTWKIASPSNMSTGRRSRSASKKKSNVKGKNRTWKIKR